MTTVIQRQREGALNKPLRVLITGIASGIGYAQAVAFMQEGHLVFGIDRQITDDLIQLEKVYNEQLAFCQADLADSESIPQWVDQAVEYLGGMDVLCNTAGQLDAYQTIDKLSLEQWQYYWNVNVTSQFMLAKYALPYLLLNPCSRIINMASIAGMTAGGGGVAYTANKHAVIGLTKQLAYDYAGRGLRVNAIAPGAIDTPMNRADFVQDRGTMAQWVADQTPVKRWAQPEEVAALTLFLASDASDYLQGVVIPLDGGWLIR